MRDYSSSSSWWRAYAGGGNDLVVGNNTGTDVLGGDGSSAGGAAPGADSLYGKKGNDILNGGSGNNGQDHLDGGPGYDTYRVWAGSYTNGASVYIYDPDEGGKLELHPATGWTWEPAGWETGSPRHGVWKHNGVAKVTIYNHAETYGYYNNRWRQRGNWDISFSN